MVSIFDLGSWVALIYGVDRCESTSSDERGSMRLRQIHACILNVYIILFHELTPPAVCWRAADHAFLHVNFGTKLIQWWFSNQPSLSLPTLRLNAQRVWRLQMEAYSRDTRSIYRRSQSREQRGRTETEIAWEVRCGKDGGTGNATSRPVI